MHQACGHGMRHANHALSHLSAPRTAPPPALVCFTGRSSGRPPAPGQLDRAAFELAVADATELLQAQLRWGSVWAAAML